MRYHFVDQPSMMFAAERQRESVTDRELREEIEFHRSRPAELKGVTTTDQVITDAQQFAFLRRLNQRMRDFWATH